MAKRDKPRRIRGTAKKAQRRSRRRTVHVQNGQAEVTQRLIQAMDVSFLALGYERARAVGRIVLKTGDGQAAGYATGFLLAGGLLVTCRHVLQSVADARSAVVQFDYQVNHDRSFAKPVEFRLDPDRFYQSNTVLDAAVVAVGSPNAAGDVVEDRGCVSLEQDAIVVAGEYVHVLQHSDGEPLSVSLQVKLLKVTEDWFFQASDDTTMSSGSPVFNDHWELVGMQHSFVPHKDNKGRWLSADGSIWDESKSVKELNFVAIESVRGSSLKLWLDSEGRSAMVTPRPRASASPSIKFAAPAIGPVRSEPSGREWVFVSYARADQRRVKWLERLDVFLRQFPKLRSRVWNDSRIEAGDDWLSEIEYGLAHAGAAVLLIGPNFLVSKFVLDNELPLLLKAAANEGVRIFPLIIEPSAYEESILGRYQAFNSPKNYLAKLSVPKQNEVLLDLARAVAKVFQPRDAS